MQTNTASVSGKASAMNTSEDAPWWQIADLCGTSSPWVADVLLPLPGAVLHARNLMTKACLQRDMPHLIELASLVACELVTNALVHAQTMADLRVVPGRSHLIIGVHDGSPAVYPPGTAGRHRA